MPGALFAGVANDADMYVLLLTCKQQRVILDGSLLLFVFEVIVSVHLSSPSKGR